MFTNLSTTSVRHGGCPGSEGGDSTSIISLQSRRAMGQRQSVRSGSRRPGRGGIVALVLAMLGSVLLGLLPALPAGAAAQPLELDYRCDGDPLLAVMHGGSVDADGIPNTSGGTVPGAFVVLHWREVRLQLPRSNNAGAPSYTDGKWWWSLEDPHRPRLRLRSGDVREFECVREP
jgi:hypothetical protein